MNAATSLDPGNTEEDAARMNRSMETLLQKRVDGLLLMCTETTGHRKMP